MITTKVMHVFIFWCSVGSILNSFCLTKGARENVKFLDAYASGKERSILGDELGIKSFKDRRGTLMLGLATSHRRRRNSGVNTTATPSKPEEHTTAPPSLPPSPTPPLPFDITCHKDLSCKGRCELERANGTKDLDEDHCYCDPYCNSFKDCCADFDQFCGGVVPTKQLEEKWRCHDDIWMIDSCPKDFSSLDLIVKCEYATDKLSAPNYADVTPVISTTGKTYKNQHCALCNGVKKKDMKSLSYAFKRCQLTPPQSYNVKQKFQFLIDYCDVVELATTGEQRMRKCGSQLIETADYCISGESEKIGCERGQYRIVFLETRRTNFKNVHCARCYGEPVEYLLCGPLSSDNVAGGSHGKPFTAVLDIGGADKTRKTMNTEVSCDYGQVYDVFLETCRQGLQFPLKKYSPKLNKYNIAMWIKTGRNNMLSIHDYPNEMIFKSLAKVFGLESQVFEEVERERVFMSPTAVLVVNLHIEKNTTKRARRDTSPEISIDMLLNFTRPFDFSIDADNFTVIKATSRLLTCVRVQYFTPGDYVVVHGSSNIYINQTQELLTEKQYFTNSTKTHNGYQIPVGWIAVCRQLVPSTLTCNGTYISLDKDEYVMLPNNSVYRNVSNTLYNQGEYSIINGSVVLCTNYSNKYNKVQPANESQSDTVLRILTYIGLSLSVFCLVFVLVTYLLFGELRTLPGINLMNLSSALLVAHFFWLIGSGQTGSYGACVALAVILHCSFLASFVWMSIIVFSTWKTFSSTGCVGRSSDKEYRRKKICHSLAIGWLPVLVMVLICLALDQSGAVGIKYSGPKGCWINNGLANLFIFILPLAVSVIWNAIFFGLTVKAIYKAKKQARMVTEQRENQRNLSIYIKIAVLKGFTWIFGFLALLKSAYFSYPFVIFNTIQGVYIAVAFTFNSRIRKLYRSKFVSSNDASKSDKSTNNTRHSTTNTRV